MWRICDPNLAGAFVVTYWIDFLDIYFLSPNHRHSLESLQSVICFKLMVLFSLLEKIIRLLKNICCYVCVHLFLVYYRYPIISQNNSYFMISFYLTQPMNSSIYIRRFTKPWNNFSFLNQQKVTLCKKSRSLIGEKYAIFDIKKIWFSILFQ